MLAKLLNKTLSVFDGNEAELRSALIENGAPGEFAPIMSHYFESLAAGRWKITDTVSRLLGRRPRSYAQWIERNLPEIRSRAA